MKVELNSLNGNWFFGGWIGIGIAIQLKKLYELELELELKKFSDQLLISGTNTLQKKKEIDEQRTWCDEDGI